MSNVTFLHSVTRLWEWASFHSSCPCASNHLSHRDRLTWRDVVGTSWPLKTYSLIAPIVTTWMKYIHIMYYILQFCMLLSHFSGFQQILNVLLHQDNRKHEWMAVNTLKINENIMRYRSHFEFLTFRAKTPKCRYVRLQYVKCQIKYRKTITMLYP
jgi:hypothetical protein